MLHQSIIENFPEFPEDFVWPGKRVWPIWLIALTGFAVILTFAYVMSVSESSMVFWISAVSTVSAAIMTVVEIVWHHDRALIILDMDGTVHVRRWVSMQGSRLAHTLTADQFAFVVYVNGGSLSCVKEQPWMHSDGCTDIVRYLEYARFFENPNQLKLVSFLGNSQIVDLRAVGGYLRTVSESEHDLPNFRWMASRENAADLFSSGLSFPGLHWRLHQLHCLARDHTTALDNAKREGNREGSVNEQFAMQRRAVINLVKLFVAYRAQDRLSRSVQGAEFQIHFLNHIVKQLDVRNWIPEALGNPYAELHEKYAAFISSELQFNFLDELVRADSNLARAKAEEERARTKGSKKTEPTT